MRLRANYAGWGATVIVGLTFCLGIPITLAQTTLPTTLVTRVPAKNLADKNCMVYANVKAIFSSEGADTLLRLEYGSGDGIYGGGWFPITDPLINNAQCRGIALTTRGNGNVPGKAFLTIRTENGGAYRSKNLAMLFANKEWNEVVLGADDFIIDPQGKPEGNKTLTKEPQWTHLRRMDFSAVNIESKPTIEFKAIAFVMGDAKTALGAGKPATSPDTTKTKATEEDLVNGPAPEGKAWEPAWGFWPKAPTFWHPTHQGMVKQIQQGPANLVFIGDSITKGWGGNGKEIWQKRYAPLGAVNLGIGGDTTRQILWRLGHGALDGAKPKVIVLMIGVNNIFTATGSNEDIARGVEEILKQIQVKCPEAKILLLGILPLGNAAQNARVQDINGILGKFQGGAIRFLDMNGKFQDAAGKILPDLYSPDQVHLAKGGYEVWEELMQPILADMLK